MNRLIERNKELIVQHFCLNLLSGTPPTVGDADVIRSITGVDTSSGAIAMIVSEIDPRLPASIEDKERLYQEIERRWRIATGEHPLLVIRFPLNSLTGVVWCGSEEPTVRLGEPVCLPDVNTTWSFPVSDLRDAPRRFRCLRKRLERRFQVGYGNLFPPTDRGEAPYRRPIETEPYRALLFQDRYSEFRSAVTTLLSEPDNQALPLYMVLDCSTRIIEHLSEAAYTKGFSDPELSYSALREEMESISSYTDLIEWLEEKTTRLEAHCSEEKDAERSHLFVTIAQYIDTHLDAKISQSTVAETFGVSTGYLSRLFREFSPWRVFGVFETRKDGGGRPTDHGTARHWRARACHWVGILNSGLFL